MLTKRLLAIILIFSSGYIFAASFDCAKAANKIEKMICSNTELSELDQKMGSQFKKAMDSAQNPQSLIQRQRGWIIERNKCADVRCLSKSYSDRIEQLSSDASNKTDTCPVTEKQLIGTWVRSEAGDFEEMAFDLNDGARTFMSWLHHQPEMPGTWTLHHCQLHIAHVNDPQLTFDYSIVKYAGDTLYLKEIIDKTISKYKKAK